MERVAQLLQDRDYRQALVRLWVLGSHGPCLNQWERDRGQDQIMARNRAQLFNTLQADEAPPLARIQSAPLALIGALEDVIAELRPSHLRARSGASRAQPLQEHGKDYWLVPVLLSARRKASLARQVGNLGLWFRRHVVLPAVTPQGVRVEVSKSRSAVDEALASVWLEADPALKVWIGHFDDAADVKWSRATSEVGNWRTLHVAPQDQRRASMLAAVSQAAKAGAHIIVFPEFTLDLDHRKALVRHLQSLRGQPKSSLILVVAGSFHEPVDGDVFNTAPVYNAAGRTVLTHRKLRLFGDLEAGAEDAAVGDSLHVLATPIGCMTVLICKDFMDSHPSVASLLTEVPVDWALVPSYGEERTIHAHRKRCKDLALQVGTHSVVAQTLNTALAKGIAPKECVRGFGHGAGKKEPEPQVGEAGGLVSFSLTLQPPK